MRQAAQLLDRRFRVVADRLELRDDPIVLDLLLRHPKLDLDRHQPLLGAVMKIALEPTALAIAGLDDPQARCAQLVEQAYVLDQHQRGRR